MADPKSSMERRKEPRFPVSLPLEYQSVCDSRPRVGLLTNLSHKGLLFHCRGDMSVGTLLNVTVMFPDDFLLSSFEIRGKIIWKGLYFDRDWREYEYGAEFLYVSQQDQEKLKGILSRLSVLEFMRGTGNGFCNDAKSDKAAFAEPIHPSKSDLHRG
jgi:hypothetical protein